MKAFLLTSLLAAVVASIMGQTLFPALVLGVLCGGFITALVLLTRKLAYTPKAARGDFLEDLGRSVGLDREYYDDLEGKPNDHCHYRDWVDVPGWYENDDTLRDRIAKRTRRND